MATKKGTTVKKETAVKNETAAKKTAVKEEKVEMPDVEIVDETSAGETKKPTNTGKTYILSKRKEDGMWALKYSGGEKVIKLFKTQKEALEFTKERSKNNDRAVLVRASKGAKKGKFHIGAAKQTEEKK